jgi:hypothetical protein
MTIELSRVTLSTIADTLAMRRDELRREIKSPYNRYMLKIRRAELARVLSAMDELPAIAVS